MALVTVNKDGRLHIHRDLSKWRTKGIGKHHSLYYETHPSPRERVAEAEIKALVAAKFKEPSAATEALLAKADLRKQEEGLAIPS